MKNSKRPHSDLYFFLAMLAISGVLLTGCTNSDDLTVSGDTLQTTTQVTQENVSPATESSVTEENVAPTTSQTTQDNASSVSTSEVTQESTGSTESSSDVKVKVYEAQGKYTSPGGPETVMVKLGVTSNNIIETIDLSSDTENGVSKKFQGLFFDGMKKELMGKNIKEVGTYDKLNGSSLTATGFNEALKKIQSEMTS